MAVIPLPPRPLNPVPSAEVDQPQVLPFPRRRLETSRPLPAPLPALVAGEPTVLAPPGPSRRELLAPDRVIPAWEAGIPTTWRPAWEIYRRKALIRPRKPVNAATLASNGQAFKQLGQFLAPRGITPETACYEDIEEFMFLLRERHAGPAGSPNSVPNGRFRALRAIFNVLAKTGALPASPMLGMPEPDIVEQRAGRPLTHDELKRLVAACVPRPEAKGKRREAPFIAARDRAIILCLADNGSRAAGLLSATEAGVDLGEQASIQIRLKGGGTFRIQLGNTASEALRIYLRHRAQHPQAGQAALWVSERGPLRTTGLRRLIKTRAAQAGIDLSQVYAHVFRHGVVVHLLREEVPETVIMGVTGHKRREMIDRYARAERERLAAEAVAQHSLADRIGG